MTFFARKPAEIIEGIEVRGDDSFCARTSPGRALRGKSVVSRPQSRPREPARLSRALVVKN
jgi:hypothetical protein